MRYHLTVFYPTRNEELAENFLNLFDNFELVVDAIDILFALPIHFTHPKIYSTQSPTHFSLHSILYLQSRIDTFKQLSFLNSLNVMRETNFKLIYSQNA